MSPSKIILLSLCFCVRAGAFEPIEGAFGKKLGETFDPATAVKKHEYTDGTVFYEFTPTNSLKNFDHYFVSISPVTRKIAAIWADCSVANYGAIQGQQKLVMYLLEEKYGPATKELLPDSTAKTICQDRRCVMTFVDGISDRVLKLKYFDADLIELAEKERLSAAAKGLDKSGL